MDKSVFCNKCGCDFKDFAITFRLREIHKGDITVQYFECPKCKTKYHICTTNIEMRGLIDLRVAIQNKIAEGLKSKIPSGTAQKLQHKLSKIIAQQKKLTPSLKKRGEEILNDSGATD